MRGYVLLLRILSKGGGFSNFELSDKTKTTFIVILRTVCKGGLPNYCWFYSCWCFYVFFLYDNLFLFIRVFFVQTSTNVFVGHTNAALMGFAPISKGLTTVHVNLDSLEMDENVKVNTGVEI